ncbi:hypothetical protein N658DRAFT_514768 [Parathielavia hyrcaniae]|uniref:Uncharacterized protein n=1 Tax=Parathielavia hyrcaniae TaxID=113614 RepID=A0AAN6T3C3_9PEZI|nr:hypothetical protein N658DRAFT_514768 [Parathielavia hyrcaniae]
METDIIATSAFSVDSLRGQRLHIPNLWPAFASWKQGVNPHHGRARQAVGARLEELIENENVLAKVKAADLGLFASGVFPDAPYQTLETVVFYCVWLFLWDDAIDGADGSEEDGGLAAEEYCRRPVGFVRFCLGLDGTAAAEAPTKVCGSFAEVGRRLGECCGLEQRRELFGQLREYMEGCLTEYRWRLSGKAPSVKEFYLWRLKTSSVDVMILNGISLSREIRESEQLAAMGLSVNKLLILINELFSLKKELKDGAFSNLVPITIRSLGASLDGAVNMMIQEFHECIRIFDSNASALQTMATAEESSDMPAHLTRLIGAYQAIATSLTMADSLHFNYPSPLAGYEDAPSLPEERAEDGKSYRNPQTGVLSSAYDKFTEPLDNGPRGGFDIHIYYFQTNPEQTQYARQLWERIRREFPELRVYAFWDRPVGPHPVAMFEVNVFTPAQFGAFVPWLAVWRGPLSALVHPNTLEPGVPEPERELRNHTQRAIWMGERLPLDLGRFRGG